MCEVCVYMWRILHALLHYFILVLRIDYNRMTDNYLFLLSSILIIQSFMCAHVFVFISPLALH